MSKHVTSHARPAGPVPRQNAPARKQEPDTQITDTPLGQLQAVANGSVKMQALQRLSMLANGQKQAVMQRAILGEGSSWSARKYILWYFSKDDYKTNKTAAKLELLQQLAIDNELPTKSSLAAMKSDLIGANAIDEEDYNDLVNGVDAFLTGGGGKAAILPERKKLSAETWVHIWRGDYNARKNRPTGYHWKGGGDDSWLEQDGGKANLQDGFYRQPVKVRDNKVDAIKDATGAKGEIGGRQKEDHSTFFPDDWSENDVRDAIELRDGSGAIRSKPATGITLVKSGKTIYPTG